MAFAPFHSSRDILANAALFLDFDGTLVDIAKTPDAVVLPPDLPGQLVALSWALDGALAIITGRSLESLDAALGALRLPAAAEHGALLRPRPDELPHRMPTPAVPAAWRHAAQALAATEPGVLVEQKPAGFVVHFRQAEAAGPQLRAALDDLLRDAPDFAVMPAQMAWEVKARSVDKGGALRALMQEAPFQGRRPVFIGDDHTDEDGMAAARALGGAGLRVQDHFSDAAGVRAWLADLLEVARA